MIQTIKPYFQIYISSRLIPNLHNSNMAAVYIFLILHFLGVSGLLYILAQLCSIVTRGEDNIWYITLCLYKVTSYNINSRHRSSPLTSSSSLPSLIWLVILFCKPLAFEISNCEQAFDWTYMSSHHIFTLWFRDCFLIDFNW